MTVGISRKKTVLALVKEVTEGVPVQPSSSSDYTALQEGFSMSPSFDVLTNAELKASIGKGKDELGSENPTASFSHYIKASGVEGQAPDYSPLLEAVFGSVKEQAAENETISGSTITAIKYDETEVVERGQAILIKDGVNGVQIRNASEVVGDTITLAQKVAVAPSSGVLLGKSVLYKAADENHPTLSVWQYLGNGGAIEMMAGARVNDFSLSAEAGQFVNGSFTLGGISYYFNPIVIGSSDIKLDFLDNSTTRVATIAAKTYKDPSELAEAIALSMNSLGSTNTFVVSYSSSTGKFTISSNGTTLSLLNNTGANAANTVADKIGFSVAANKTGALTYTSDSAINLAAPQSPSYDDVSAFVAKSNEAWLGGVNDIGCFKAQSVSISIANTKTDIPDLCEDSGKSGSLFTERVVTTEVTALLSKYDAEKYRKFRTGENVQFTYNFGAKSGGQWVAGKVANVFLPTNTITALSIEDQDGLCILNMTLTAYVQDGKPEVFLNFL